MLLILAGVSIAMLTGENGILTQAQKAGEQTDIGQEKEAISLAYNGAKAENEGKGVSDKDLDKQFELNKTDADASGTGTITVTFGNGRTYMINENGTITGPLEKPEQTEEPESGGEEFIMTSGVIEIKWLIRDTNFVSETANAPVIKTDIPNTTMKLVKYENGNWVEGTDYNYKAGTGTADNRESRWANAEVEIDYGEGNQKIKSYFVWIPRYAYRIIYFKDDPSKREYLNEKITEDEAVKQGKIIGYSDSRGIVSIDTEGTVKKVSGTTSLNISGNYFRVHPAFIDDSKNNYENGGWNSELLGIWVGKYESSRSDAGTKANTPGTSQKIAVVPGVTSWRSSKIGDMYNYAKEYSTNLNSHMLKNSEWGAVVYLTESKYGRNGAEKVKANANNDYLTANGDIVANKLQSSTGNETGIYDLSGGAYEYVASYLANGDFSYANSTFTNNVSDEFSTAYTVAEGKTGDATSETEGWNGDLAHFADSSNPFFIRGGYNRDPSASITGVFYYSKNPGKGGIYYSFRMCLAVK